MRVRVKTLPGREIVVPYQPFQGGSAKPPWEEIFPDPCPNIVAFAKKKSGKTTVLYNILERMLPKGSKTRVLIFCPTYQQDKMWRSIIKMLDERGIVYTAMPSFKGHDTATGRAFNQLQDLQRMLNEKSDNRYIAVYDDLSIDLKDKYLENLVKQNRHKNIINIVSTQYLNDLPPGSLSNFDFFLLFHKIPPKKLQEIHGKMGIGLEYDLFQELYDKAVSVPYGFLWVQSNPENYRLNFSGKVELDA